MLVKQKLKNNGKFILVALASIGVLIFSVSIVFANYVETQESLDGAGHLDFSYGTTVASSPTGEKPESKLWWNDGVWWGYLWSPKDKAYHIFKLNWNTQTWIDTGVQVDDRPDTKADVLWDDLSKRLYIVSHIYHINSSSVKSVENKARLYRFSFSQSNQKYSLDQGFPVVVNNDKTEAVVVAKDAEARIWVTYVSREPDIDPNDYKVYVNASTDDGLTWGSPFVLPVSEVHVSADDISSVVTFHGAGGPMIGVMWTNQLSKTLNFAVRSDSTVNLQAGWTLKTIKLDAFGIDDHVNLKSLRTNSSGQVFGVVKTSATQPADPLILLVARDVDGSFSLHTYSTKADADTRPMMLIDEADPSNPNDDRIYVFVTGKESGSEICYKTLLIKSLLSAMGDFPQGDCGTPFIKDSTYNKIDNATSTKQNVNAATGIVVLASDDVNGKVYVHNTVTFQSTFLPLIMKNP